MGRGEKVCVKVVTSRCPVLDTLTWLEKLQVTAWLEDWKDSFSLS